MDTATTQGVKISVQTSFRGEMSNVKDSNFFFKYFIEIENTNPFPVKLITRHWKIFDALDVNRFVDGEGVIGEQPVIEPGEVFVYSSGCDLISETGYMEGFYDFAQLDHGSDAIVKHFRVKVPRFQLVYPYLLN